MRLINLGLGELADRLTILALKIAHGQQASKDVAHFVTERNALLVQVRTAATDPGLEFLFELAAVNAMLWYAEDHLREWRQQFAAESCTSATWVAQEPDAAADAVEIAFRIQALNDRRAELVSLLNKSAGTDYGPEKI